MQILQILSKCKRVKIHSGLGVKTVSLNKSEISLIWEWISLRNKSENLKKFTLFGVKFALFLLSGPYRHSSKSEFVWNKRLKHKSLLEECLQGPLCKKSENFTSKRVNFWDFHSYFGVKFTLKRVKFTLKRVKFTLKRVKFHSYWVKL